MFSKKNKKKLSPLERAQQEEREKEEKRRGALLKDQLYPLLLETTENVEDCKMFLQTLQLVIEQAFMNLKREKVVFDLQLTDENHMRDNPESQRYRRLLELLQYENVASALDILTSMNNIIQNNERTLMKDKKLAELPIRFITYDHGN